MRRVRMGPRALTPLATAASGKAGGAAAAPSCRLVAPVAARKFGSKAFNGYKGARLALQGFQGGLGGRVVLKGV